MPWKALWIYLTSAPRSTKSSECRPRSHPLAPDPSVGCGETGRGQGTGEQARALLGQTPSSLRPRAPWHAGSGGTHSRARQARCRRDRSPSPVLETRVGF